LPLADRLGSLKTFSPNCAMAVNPVDWLVADELPDGAPPPPPHATNKVIKTAATRAFARREG